MPGGRDTGYHPNQGPPPRRKPEVVSLRNCNREGGELSRRDYNGHRAVTTQLRASNDKGVNENSVIQRVGSRQARPAPPPQPSGPPTATLPQPLPPHSRWAAQRCPGSHLPVSVAARRPYRRPQAPRAHRAPPMAARPGPTRVRKKVCPGSWVRSGADPRAEPLLSQVGGETRRSGPHLRTLVTRPEPTVRPPSRMAKPRPSSMAMGWMSSTVISVVSPGMTISVPSGRVMTPVTSVVRK